MDSYRWSTLSHLFDSALDLPADDREAFIASHCGNDTELASELRRMLAADESSGEFLERPLVVPNVEQWSASVISEYAIGSRQFGPYRLLRPIGHGGMGEVHLAERGDGAFEQRVALKLLPHPTPGLIQRFRQERQILARLEHANIARLLDGGLGENNIPYFAMEYVDGEPVTMYAQSQALDIPAILNLFLQICDAVQYAHRNLVVHRDLKPSNILVTGDGTPKLLDFGIAKVLQTTGPSDATQTASRVYTPDYAAPEQIRGEPVTTATDVYALGVVLYELLAGTKPYTLSRNTTLENAILQIDPSAPSVAAKNALRRKPLRGDLDRIVLTALAKEPERRYSSVELFAVDVRNYLAGRPIIAHGDAAMYRLHKFIRRNRVGVTAAAAVFLALVAATSISLWQAHRANIQAQRAEVVKNFLASVFAVNNPDESKGETVTARALLDNGAARIDTELDGQPALKAELTQLIGNLYYDLGVASRSEPLLKQAAELNGPDIDASLHGRILLDLSIVERNRGDYVDALAHEQAAIVAANDVRDRTLSADVRHEIAQTYQRQGDFEKAEAAVRAAMIEDSEIHGAQSGQVAEDMHNLGVVLDDLNRYDEADPIYQKALVIYRKVFGDVHTNVAALLSDYGLMLHDKGDLAPAERLEREALAMHRKIEGDEHPQTLETESNLATILDDEGKYDETLTTYRHILEIRKRTLGAQHPQVAVTLNNLARTEHAHSDFASAETHLREAIAVWSATVGAQHPDTAHGWRNLAAVLRDGDKFAESETAAREALRIDRTHYPDASEQIAACMNSIGKSQRLQGHFNDALASYRAAIDDLKAAGREESGYTADSLTGLGETQRAAGDIAAARATLTQAVAAARKAYPEGNHQIAEPLIYLGRSELAAGNAEAAEKELREALGLREKVFKADDRRMLEIDVALAESLTALGRRGEATALASTAATMLNGRSTTLDRALLARAKAITSIAK
jgi:eukaryotic-like serine/threonine-protein kinase